ncbi:hypothetical protein, partial [Hymenobacter arcticus]
TTSPCSILPALESLGIIAYLDSLLIGLTQNVCHCEQREAIAPEWNRSGIVLMRLPRSISA